MMTTDLKCPFAQPLVSEDMQCCNGTVVARRAGPDISCHDVSANNSCNSVYPVLLNCMLEELGMDEVDLNQIPHSALMKVQYGGLAGLASEIDDEHSIEDVSKLVQAVLALHGQAENIPLDNVRESIRNYQVKRRRKKK